MNQDGKYVATFSFTDGKGKKYTVPNEWEVKDHSTLHLTGDTKLQASMTKLAEEVEHADKAADSALEKVQALEARIARLDQQVTTLKARGSGSAGSSGWTAPVAILGLVASVLALGGVGLALSRSKGGR